MAFDFVIKQGDRVPEISATLKDATGTAVNLTGNAGVAFRMTAVGSSTPKVNAAATVDSAVAGTVRYVWAALDVDTPGVYFGEWQVTWGDGRTTTFPNDTNLLIRVVGQLA